MRFLAIATVAIGLSFAVSSDEAVSASAAAPWLQAASGQECPVGSKQYCGSKAPQCCNVKGVWGCYKVLSDCHE